jgi:DNA helicase II / ATP-dependent DNA helicase PcrA
MTKKTWSQYQQAVFADVAEGHGHTVIKAVAGSGKTTTIVEALNHVRPGLKTLFVAFNKAIAEELKKQAPPTVEVSTLHSYGLKTITRSLGRLRINNYRLRDIVKEWRRDGKLESIKELAKLVRADKETGELEGEWELLRDLERTVSLAKGFLSSEEGQIGMIIDDFEIRSPLAEETLLDPFARDVLELLLRCADVSDGCIDFDDMIWLPIVLELRQLQFDRVFVDETQDLNPAQIELVMRSVKKNGRVFAVGDPRQAIYRFRGADSAAMSNVIERLSAKTLPLSVCYRCCKAVIRKAQEIVPEIEYAPGATEGVVMEATVSEMKRDVKPGDFILSRTNAPLISLCMSFLREGRRATIQGRDIGASLAAFVKKSAAKDVSALRDYVELWRDTECKRLSAKRRDTQSVEDRAECILALSEGAETVRDVLSSIERMFDDKKGEGFIVLSSTHKAKGLERDTVWALTGTYRRKPEVEEDNLWYVCVTRAQRKLVLVSGEFSGRKRPSRGER